MAVGATAIATLLARGLLGLGVIGGLKRGYDATGAYLDDNAPVSGNQPNYEFDANNNTNVESANEIISKQTNPAVQNNGSVVNSNIGSGQVDADGNVAGHSSIQSDIDGDPDGGSLLDASVLDDSSIVQGASDAVKPYYDPHTNQTFPSYEGFLDYKDEHPNQYAWSMWRPFRKFFTGRNYSDDYLENQEIKRQAVVKQKEIEARKTIKEKEYDLKRKEMQMRAMEGFKNDLLSLAADRQPFEYKMWNE